MDERPVDDHSSDLYGPATPLDIAAELPPAERQAYIAELSVRDPALHEKLVQDLARLAAKDRLKAQSLEVGMEFDGYLLLEVLGEGGFGQVWRAKRPGVHSVALKVARRFIGRADEVRMRLEVERLALHRLKHDGIAKIVDVGVEPVPYFAMELIEGLSISEHARPLVIAQRVDLVIDLCRALEYAHGQGVLHRDLKPSNVLVQVQGDVARVKVIDFGIARLFDAAGRTELGLTETGTFAGTAGYSSPEQVGLEVAGRAAKVGPAADVFGVGRLLFELLAGEPAIDPKLDARSMVRQVLEEDGPGPRERLASNGGRPASVPQDLDTIVRRATRRLPSERYPSIKELREDLERWRAGAPVLARPPGAIERALRFSRRHALGLALSAVVLTALVTIAVVSERGRRRAETERARQERTTEALARHLRGLDVSALASVLREELEAQVVRGADATGGAAPPPELARLNYASLARNYFDRAYLDDAESAFDTALSEEPLVLARLLQTITQARINLGLNENAVESARRSHERFVATLGADAEETLEAQYQLALALIQSSGRAEGSTLLVDLVERAERALGADTFITLQGRLLAARLRGMQGETLPAEADLEALIDDLTALPDSTGAELYFVWVELGQLQFQRSAFAEAAATYRAGLELVRRTPSATELSRLTLELGLGQTLATQGQFGDAPALEEAQSFMPASVARLVELLGDEHPSGLAALNAAMILARARGDVEELASTSERMWRGFAALHGATHPQAVLLQANHVVALVDAGQTERAESLALATLAALGESDPMAPIVRALLAGERGRLRASTANFAEAEPFLLECERSYSALFGDDNAQVAQVRRLLAEFYRTWHGQDPSLGHDARASAWLERTR